MDILIFKKLNSLGGEEGVELQATKSAESGGNGLPQGRECKSVNQQQTVSSENVHTRNVTQNVQATFRNLGNAYMHAITNGKRGHGFETGQGKV